MSELIVVAFDRLEDARAALAKLRTLEREGLLALKDAVIVERLPDGSAHVRNPTRSPVESPVLIGSMLGALIGFLYPLAGVVIGAAAGAAIGKFLDRGVAETFVDDLRRILSPGRSALFLLVEPADVEAVVAALRPFRGELIQTTLDGDAEDELRRALAA